MVVDPARPRGAGLPDAAAAARREPGAGGGAGRRRRLRRRNSSCIPRRSRSRRRASSCAAPIKWIEDRREHFVAAVQERDQYWDLEVACDQDGRLLGVRGRMIHDEGAYTPQGINLPYNASTALPGPYVLPAYDLLVQVVETNKVATMPVRGAGYPEGAFAMERLLDRIAQKLGLDRAEVRRRNLVPPERMPYVTPVQDALGLARSRSTAAIFPLASRARSRRSTMRAFAARQSDARARGRYLGIGIGDRRQGHGARALRIGHRAHRPLRARLGLSPARCRWGRASRPRSRRSAPSSSAFRPMTSA